MTEDYVDKLKREYTARMRIINQNNNSYDCRDDEKDHRDADALLCELLNRLGFDELVELYNCLEMWYG